MASATSDSSLIVRSSSAYKLSSSSTLQDQLNKISTLLNSEKNDEAVAAVKELPTLIQNCLFGKLWVVMGSPTEATHPSIACWDFGKAVMLDEHSGIKASCAEKAKALEDYLSGPKAEVEFVALTLDQKLQKIIRLFKDENNGPALIFLKELPSQSQKRIQGKLWEVLGSPTPSSHPDIARADFGKAALFDTHPGKRATGAEKAQAVEAYFSDAHIELEIDQLQIQMRNNEKFLNDASFSCNNPKNAHLRRFFCYDNTLVKLSHGGFIHANAVLGGKYILTQCPLKSTVEDFWTMVGELKATTIVMLNELTEKDCFPYWPTELNEKQPFGKNTLTLLRSKDTYVHAKGKEPSKITTRKIAIEDNIVTHIQHQSWHDHTICELTSCIELIEQIKESQSMNPGPIVIHCQAGVGRTGVVTVVCELYDNATAGRPYNVQKIVDSLRSPITGRHPYIVANDKQYRFTHQVLNAVRKKPTTKPLTPSKITEIALSKEPLNADKDESKEATAKFLDS